MDIKPVFSTNHNLEKKAFGIGVSSFKRFWIVVIRSDVLWIKSVHILYGKQICRH